MGDNPFRDEWSKLDRYPERGFSVDKPVYLCRVRHIIITDNSLTGGKMYKNGDPVSELKHCDKCDQKRMHVYAKCTTCFPEATETPKHKNEVKFCRLCGFNTAHVDDQCMNCVWKKHQRDAGRF